MHDPISDMLIRIKNAQAVNKQTVFMPHSKLKQEIARVLKTEKFITDFEKKGRGPRKKLEIKLSYEEGNPGLSDFKRRSRLGQRSYIGYRELFPVKNGYGIGLISTSKGVMSDKEARKQRVGGELIAEIW
jgi:small subunit ribosomal protein S8